MARQRFDVLVSHSGIPGVDGFALVGKIRRLPANRGGRIPVFALTAFAGGGERTRGLSAGYHLHVANPIEPAELTTVIASLSERYTRTLATEYKVRGKR